MAFPRYLDGVCATLARSSLVSPTGEPSWDPFPSWEAQTKGDPKSLQNVVDVLLESGPKEVLWVLDTGITQSLSSPVVHCGPKVVGFDPTSGKVIFKTVLKNSLRKAQTSVSTSFSIKIIINFQSLLRLNSIIRNIVIFL